MKYLWMPILLFLLTWLFLRGPMKQTEGQILEKESAYNYIQVVEREGTRYLLLNEGQGIHSVYHPDRLLTQGTWDYFLSAPFFNPAPMEPEGVKRLGLVGLAGGTIARQYTEIYGEIPIDGWEIDPAIIEIGREYFGMDLPNLNAMATDGRWGLAHSHHFYNVIGVDAYRLPYIPFHLTTNEFFQIVKEHLDEDGVAVINVGRTFEDRRLIEAMAGTMASVFPSLYLVDVPETFNSILYGTKQPTSPENIFENYQILLDHGGQPILLDAIERTILNLKPVPPSEIVFTDDWAPIEQLTDSIAIQFVLQGEIDSLR